MKYYSEITKKTYDTEKECLKAEEEVTIKSAKRKAAADRVEDKYKAMKEAEKMYFDELDKFCKEYGTYHRTITNKDLDDAGSNEIKDLLNRILW